MRLSSAVLTATFVVTVMLFTVHPAGATIIYCGENPRQIALTFDDGPSFKYSMKVLDILKKEKVKATFFIVGQKAEEFPEILKMMADGGHELENHTYYHSRLNGLTDNKLLEELDETSKAINRITGRKVAYFRPPFGVFDAAQRKLIEKAGYKMVLWTVNADDFYHIGWGMRTAKSIEKKVLLGVRGGDVVLAHDDSKQLVEALPVIIDSLKKRGYTFVTLSELVEIKRAGK
jgi:peptidoglycan-N-acetylglucosamine deacetylase